MKVVHTRAPWASYTLSYSKYRGFVQTLANGHPMVSPATDIVLIVRRTDQHRVISVRYNLTLAATERSRTRGKMACLFGNTRAIGETYTGQSWNADDFSVYIIMLTARV